MTRLHERREELLRIAERHGAYKVRAFGPVVGEEAGPGTAVAFLVEMEQGRTLYDFVTLKQELEEALGGPVDVVTEPSLHWFVRERVLAQAQPL